jgi:flavin-binding protein dodecin
MAATESLQQRLAEVFKDVQPTQSTLLDVAAAITDAIVKVLSEACRNILAVDWSSQRNTIQRQISDVLEQGRLPQFIKIRLPDAVMDALAEAQRRVLAVDWSKLLEIAMQWPKDHPYKTIFVLFCAVSYKYPGLLFKPALKVLGYSLRGPRAG